MREIVSPLDGIRSPFGFIRGGGVVPFSPSTLFASGEEGAWYEPSTTTAFTATYSGGGFTDIAPAGYGDLCAILLDKSQGAGYSGGSFTGLGSELVTNGTFDTADLTGWVTSTSGTLVSSVALGQLELAHTGTSVSQFSFPVSVTAGSSYIFSGQVSSDPGGSAASLLLKTSSSSTSGVTLATVFSTPLDGSAASGEVVYVAATTTTVWVALRQGITNTTRLWDNISVRELPGNHATQGTESARPILARVPEGGRRNLLEYTEEFDNAYWTEFNSSINLVSSGITAPYGTGAVYEIIEDTATGGHSFYGPASVTGQFTFSIHVKYKSKQWFRVDAYTASSGTSNISYFDVLNGEKGLEGSGLTTTITPVGDDGWYRITVSGNAGGSVITFYPGLASANGTASYTGDGTSGTYIWGAQLEAASSASDYQKVVDQYDITEAGVTSLEYLAFDGSDDGMATASIDFTATDKMSVFAGVEKDSETQNGQIAELSVASSSNNGAFYTTVNSASGTDDFAVFSHGDASASASQVASSDDAQPALVVLSGLHDISGDSNILRLNGSQIAEATVNLGAGNFGNYPLYIGSRANTSLFFDGKLFSLIVRGAASTAQETSDTESYVANLSGVTL